MAQTITNQARLDFVVNEQSGSALSNIATATLSDVFTVDKNSVQSVYQSGEELTYVVSFVNSGQTAVTGVAVTDDLGTYTVGTVDVTPLTFVGSALLYVNGVYSGTPATETAEGGVSFTVPTVPAGANVVIVYNARVNSGALLAEDAQITNTVTVDAEALTAPVTAANTITAGSYADVRITKSMSPANVSDGAPITYEFDLYNYGNTAATNIVLTDQFDPAPASITVQVNGTLVDPADYTYANGLLTLPSGTGLSLSLPAAAFAQDSTTGNVTVTPSSSTIIVTGIP